MFVEGPVLLINLITANTRVNFVFQVDQDACGFPIGAEKLFAAELPIILLFPCFVFWTLAISDMQMHTGFSDLCFVHRIAGSLVVGGFPGW